jgi:hypothetical protein
MAEQFLHGTDVLPTFKQVGSEAVSKRMATGGFLYARPSDGRFDGILQVFLSYMVTAQLSRTWIYGSLGGGKNILPNPGAVSAQVFANERGWQKDAPRATGEIAGMKMPDAFEVELKPAAETLWQHRHPFPHPFAVPHSDLTIAEVDIFDAEPQAFEQPQSAPVKELAH